MDEFHHPQFLVSPTGKVHTRLALPRVYVLRELVDVRSAEFRAGLRSGEIRKMARTSSGNSPLSFLRGNLQAIRSVRFYVMDADLEPGVSQDTGPQSNELRQPASYLGRFRFSASALVRTLRRPRTASLNIRLALIQGAALQAARGRLK
jgi:hypothetical protein